MPGLAPSQLLAEIEALASGASAEHIADPDLRTRLYGACQKASLALEQPTETVVRLLLAQPVESTLLTIALNLKLFEKLAAKEASTDSLDALVASTNADKTLLKRVLRALAAFGAVEEVGHESYKLAPQYELLTNAQFGQAVLNCADFLNRTYNALPALLESTNYQEPTDPSNTAVQKAFGVQDKDLLGILTERPASAQGFGTLMSTWGEGHALLQHLYPVQEELIQGYDPSISPVMLVDVGGGYGQKAIALKEAFPQLPGRVIVQDLPMTIDHAPQVEGIEFMSHDFFTEQPILSARAYYIRQCLHNWPDEKCVVALSQLRAAMKPGYSKLLIHEQISPESGASTWVSIQDINMMALCGVAERTEETWRTLVSKAGLVVQRVVVPEDGVSEGVIEATLPL